MPYLDELEHQRKAAYARFTQQEAARSDVQEQLEVAAPLEVDSASRVAVRRALIPANDSFAQERIIAENNLTAINYLALGMEAARPVARIHIRDRHGRPAGFGTGFLISPSLLLTNHHVLASVDFARRSFAEFEFELDTQFLPKPTQMYRLDPARFFYNNRELDFALVAVHPLSLNQKPLADYGYLPLIAQSGKVLLGEAVTIIQHPEGGDKHIALRSNNILNLLDGFLHYTTDTMPGSSGSPVFNDQWQVAALHHSGVPRVDSQGRILNKSGHIWRVEMGDDAIDWIGNEGVRISSIVEHLLAHSAWHESERKLLEQIDSVMILTQTTTTIVVETPAVEPIVDTPPTITVDEFWAMVDDPDTTEADLAPYIRHDPQSSGAYEPLFRLNNERVVDPRGLESDRVLGWANVWARNRRQAHYRRKVAANPDVTRIVSEGDSWFQFPFILDDIVDNVGAPDEYAVYSLDAAGDHLHDMVNIAEYIGAIEREKPRFFLISGGGNDLVGGGNLAKVVHAFAAGLAPEAYLNDAFTTFTAQVRSDYTRLFTNLQNRFPQLITLCHGYDYPIPKRGQWLGAPLITRGIEDEALQRQILVAIMDQINDTVEEVAAGFANVHYINARNVVTAQNWFDELHPNNRGFRDISALFLDRLRSF